MGGKNKAPAVPDVTVPSVGDLANQSINANIQNLPKLLAAYQQYGPQYAQSINDIFSQQQKRLGELYPQQYSVLNPLSSGIAANLNFINQNPGGLPEPIRLAGENNLRSAQAARGVAESPASALSEAQYLGGLGEQFRQSVTGEGLQFLATPPLTTPGSTQSLDTLGLDPISNTDLFKGGQNLAELNVNNAWTTYDAQLEAYRNKQAHQQQIAQALGFIGGPVAGGIYGASSGMGFGQGALYGTGGSIRAAGNVAASGVMF